MMARLQLILPIALLCAVAALLTGGLVIIDCHDRSTEDSLFRKHQDLLDVKQSLVQIEYEIILARVDERRSLTSRESGHLQSFNDRAGAARRQLEALFSTENEAELGRPILLVLAGLDRYRDAVTAVGTAQRQIGLGGDQGHLVDLARLERHLEEDLESLHDAALIHELARTRLRARDLRSNLDVTVASGLLDQVSTLGNRIRDRELGEEVSRRLLDQLARYREVVSRLLTSLMELDLATTESTLQFERILPHLRLGHSLVDDRLGQTSALIRGQQRTSRVLLISLFGAATTLLAAFILWQAWRERRLVRRLRALASTMREVAEGHAVAPAEDRLPQGRDQAGVLSEIFATLAAQNQSQHDTLERERARAESAESTSRGRAQRMANASHEMKTSLSGMLGLLELLEQTEITAEQASYIHIVRNNGEALLALTSDAHEQALLAGGTVELERREFSLSACLDSALELFRPRALEKGLALERTIAPGVPDQLIGDDTRLRQVLNHLIGGAIKFTGAGQVSVFVSMTPHAGARVELSFVIRDVGSELSAEAAANLFKPPARGSAVPQHTGASMGMSICAELVEMMGGRIWTEEDARGLRFCFTAPLEAAAQPEAGEAQDRPREAPHKLATDLAERFPLRILLAEDTEVNQMLMTRLFDKMGYTLDVAKNGREAVEMCRRRPYDLILMDIQMPEMDGWEAAGIILQETDPELRPRIVAVTANASEENRQRCLSVGMDDFVSKPFTLRGMQTVVERWSARPGA